MKVITNNILVTVILPSNTDDRWCNPLKIRMYCNTGQVKSPEISVIAPAAAPQSCRQRVRRANYTPAGNPASDNSSSHVACGLYNLSVLKPITQTIVSLAVAICIMAPAQGNCTTNLREFRGTELPLAILEGFRMEVIPEGNSSLEAATLSMLGGFSLINALRIAPSPEFGKFVVFVASGWVETAQGAQAATQVLLVNSAGTVFSLPVDTARGNGNLERICIFPEQSNLEKCLILLSFSQGANSPVFGFCLGSDGQLWNVDCSSAKTLFGWFEIRDLNDDGSFELLTTRSMDGVPGGFSYSAVRAYKPDALAFSPDPDSYLTYFKEELEWLDWVVATKDEIQLDPDSFVNPSDQGPFFLATYKGTKYGFDSIVELPVPEGNYYHLEQFNIERVASYNRVKRYRAELGAWLDGGPYPLFWNLSR